MDLKIRDLIQSVRNELIESEKERKIKGLPPLFYVDALRIEANFMAEKSNKDGGKVDFKIVSIGSDKGNSSASIHKIILDLKSTATLADVASTVITDPPDDDGKLDLKFQIIQRIAEPGIGVFQYSHVCPTCGSPQIEGRHPCGVIQPSDPCEG